MGINTRLGLIGSFVALMTLSVSPTAHGGVIYNEGVSGDLSNSQAAPTGLALALGTNSVIGNLHTTVSTDTQDWIALTVPAGLQMSSIVLAAYQSADAQGFTGFQIGSTFVGSTGTPGSYAGYAHFGTGATNGSLPPTNLVGADLLPIMHDNSPTGTSPGATGFTLPLPAGVYTFLIQQTGSTATSYQFDYNLSAVPEPGCGLGMVAVAAMLSTRRYASRRV